jgi:hypothetical protein
MSAKVSKTIAASARWPKTVHSFGNELRRIAPQVRLHGLSISFDRRRGDRIVTLKSNDVPAGRRSTDIPPS